jgi:3-(methylthio)propanoyl-CoA dehydrogenase
MSRRDPVAAAAVAFPFLKMFGIVLGATLLAKQAGAAAKKLSKGEGDAAFLQAKITTAFFFAEEILPDAAALNAIVMRGSSSTLFSLTEEQFAL